MNERFESAPQPLGAAGEQATNQVSPMTAAAMSFWSRPWGVLVAMAVVGLLLFVILAVVRGERAPELVRASESADAVPVQPLPQPVVAPPAAAMAPAAAAPVSAPGLSSDVAEASVAGTPPNPSVGGSSPAPPTGETVVSPADGVYVGEATAVSAGRTGEAVLVEGAVPNEAAMSEAELREWRRRNAESMRVLEATTPEAATRPGESTPPKPPSSAESPMRP